MNTFSAIRELAKSIKHQNFFLASKEINGMTLFKNSNDLSNIQSIFLSYLYSYDLINKEIVTEKISKHVLDNEVYTDAYLLWRKQKKDKEITENKFNDVSLVAGRKIKFPNKEVK